MFWQWANLLMLVLLFLMLISSKAQLLGAGHLSEARAQSIPLSKNHLVSKSRHGPDICFTLFYLLFNLQMWEHLAPPVPHTDLECVHRMNQASPKPGPTGPAWAGVPWKGVGEGDLIFLEPLGLLSGTLAVEKLWWLANAVFHKADSFFKLSVPPTLTAMIPSSLLIMVLIYTCSGNIADSFF